MQNLWPSHLLLQLRLLVRKTLTLEPGDADHPDHGAHDDGPHSEQAELGGSVALVDGTVVRALVSLGVARGGEDVSVAVHNTEI